jgi:phage shock protein PspC (stress-responsive transcriptional regulator)
MTNTTSTPSTAKTLHRSDNRAVGGVCAGIAEYLGIDTTLVRIGTAVLVLFGGSGLPLYLVAWVVMPDSRGDVIAGRWAKRISEKASATDGKVHVPDPYGSAPTAPAAAAPQAPDEPAGDPTRHEPPAA